MGQLFFLIFLIYFKKYQIILNWMHMSKLEMINKIFLLPWIILKFKTLIPEKQTHPNILFKIEKRFSQKKLSHKSWQKIEILWQNLA